MVANFTPCLLPAAAVRIDRNDAAMAVTEATGHVLLHRDL